MSEKSTIHRFEFLDNVLEVEEYPFNRYGDFNVTMDFSGDVKVSGWKVFDENEFRLLVYNDEGYVRLHVPIEGFDALLDYLLKLKEHYDDSNQNNVGEDNE